jgi:hypothetical protein
MVRVLAMTSHASSAKRGDGRLWVAALGLSLLCNAAIVLLIGLAAVESAKFQRQNVIVAPAVQGVRIIAPELLTAAPKSTAAETPAANPAPPQSPGFARTSEDQHGKRPDKPAFIGERDTVATSDASPDPTAPPLPAQAGIQPRDATDIETTESRYRDGALNAEAANTPEPLMPPSPAAPATPEMTPAMPEIAKRGETTTHPGSNDNLAVPPRSQRLADGPNPVDVPADLTRYEEDPNAATRMLPRDGMPDIPPTPDDPTKHLTAAPPPEMPAPPAFSGYQRKTVIQGSISRSGRSALDVEDSALGRYQATISRAIELEWQRNCMRYRDSITPGFLTVRFFVDAKGKVRNVQSVGAMQTGQIQKGFTFNSIHDAAIPAMPRELGRDYQEDPLELIFNFYF